MRIWLTAPYDKNGIEEVETDADPVGDFFSVTRAGRTTSYQNWFREGVTWHRTREGAEAAARAFRQRWIDELTSKLAAIRALPVE